MCSHINKAMCICLSNIKAHGIVYLFMLIYVNELSLPVKIQAQPSFVKALSGSAYLAKTKTTKIAKTTIL